MAQFTTYSLESNKKIKFDFGGGELSSDSGLLLIREFVAKIGLLSYIGKVFHTNDPAKKRVHKDADNLMQIIYQIISGYFEDDCADELTNDPIMTAVLDKDRLASQPTLSRFWNRMDQLTLDQLNEIYRAMRKAIYAIDRPEFMVFDLDTTLLNTYGNQEDAEFNYHYQSVGYHPFLCFNGINGDLLKAELRKGAEYCSKGSGEFMRPLLQEFQGRYPYTQMFLRGDSGFAAPELYKVCEEYDCKYAIRLKENSKLKELAKEKDDALYDVTRHNQIDFAHVYGEFMYQAGSWDHPRRVVFQIEKPYGRMDHAFTFVVTTMDSEPYRVLHFYCGRGNMENFIKEGKGGFDFSSVSSSSRMVNANRLQIHGLAYNIINWFRRLALAAGMQKLRIDAIRLKLMKIASRVVHTGRYTFFRLCSSCPYQEEFITTLTNIQKLSLPLLE
jgi:hypothetical protein